jgi:hypothetical protein
MITGAVWTDTDHDGWADLIIAGEWMPITVFKNIKGRLQHITASNGLQHTTGLWTTLAKADINHDGFDDVLAGNWGQNSKLKASKQFPLKMFTGDFDNNGIIDQLLAVAENGNYYPFLNREELEKRLPGLIRKKYPTYASFAGQTMTQILEGSAKAREFSAEMLNSVLLVNDQKGAFTVTNLPYQAQWSTIHSFLTTDCNSDGKTDIITGGNFYGTIPYEGRYDAGGVNVLLQHGNTSWSWLPWYRSGLPVNGEIRDIKTMRLAGNKMALLFALNNGRIFIAATK